MHEAAPISEPSSLVASPLPGDLLKRKYQDLLPPAPLPVSTQGLNENEAERVITRNIFEAIHYRFGTNWLSLLEEAEAVEEKKKGFRLQLEEQQALIDQELFKTDGEVPLEEDVEGEEDAKEDGGTTKKIGFLDKLSVPLFSSHRWYHSLGIEIQSAKQRHSETKKEKTSALEDTKLILFHYSCERYLGGVGIKPNEITTTGMELERVLQKFASESGLGVEDVYDSCFGEVRELLFHMKKAGDIYQRLYYSLKNVKSAIRSVEGKWLLLKDDMTSVSTTRSAGDIDKALGEISEEVKALQALMAKDSHLVSELKRCTRDISRKSAAVRLRTQKKSEGEALANGIYVQPKNGDDFISLPTRASQMIRRSSMLSNLAERSKSADTINTIAFGDEDDDLQLLKGSYGKKKGVKAKLRSFSSRNAPQLATPEGTGSYERPQVFLPAGVDTRVYYFLQQQGCLKVYDAFLKEGLTFEALTSLNESKLISMSVHSPALRKTILHATQRGGLAGHSVIKKGWMVKKGDRVKNWKMRFFILLDCGELRYFDAEDVPKANGFLPLAAEAIICAPSQDKGARDYAFDVITPSRTYVLCCASEMDYNDWIAKLKSVINGTK